MKIWIVELTLKRNNLGEYDMSFKKYLDDEDYVLNHNKNRWECIKLIPVSMTSMSIPDCDGMIIFQGFDLEPSRRILESIKLQMLNKMKCYIEREKMNFINDFNKKLDSINEFCYKL